MPRVRTRLLKSPISAVADAVLDLCVFAHIEACSSVVLMRDLVDEKESRMDCGFDVEKNVEGCLIGIE